ncbi:MAG: SBBP repeat-containing protein [Candidatus Cloacimonetes bacterium]|nr:SBBP repeat-containing protein [Candidatus Cloacimonadota bacterium]
MKKELILTFTLLLMINTVLMAQTPEWQWATQAGGSIDDFGRAIAIDDNGNCYVSGYFNDTVTFGSYSLTSSGSYDIFAAKMDANGNWLWATKAGGINFDMCHGIALDENGNTYITGYFGDTATFGSYSLTSSGSNDIVTAKLDANGNWSWATKAGGSNEDGSLALVIDDNGNSYVTGSFSGTATFGSYSLTSSGQRDIFIAKMDTNGNWLWATKAGGVSEDRCFAIAKDDNDNSYVTGWFTNTATFGSYSLTSSGEYDIFVAKLGNDTSVENEIIPMKMELSNYPNPFNPSTTIEFLIQNDSNVDLTIYNIKGQKINTLAHNEFTKGSHSIIWNGDDENNNSVSSGVYLYKLNVNGKTEAVMKCLLLK